MNKLKVDGLLILALFEVSVVVVAATADVVAKAATHTGKRK